MVVAVVEALLLDVGPRPGEPATACPKALQSRSPPSEKSLKSFAFLMFFSHSNIWARDRLGKSVKKHSVFIAFQQRLLKSIVFFRYYEKSPDSVSDRVAGQGRPAMGDRGHSERPDHHQWTPTNSEMYAKPLCFTVCLRHRSFLVIFRHFPKCRRS